MTNSVLLPLSTSAILALFVNFLNAAAAPIEPAELQHARDARWSEEKAWRWYDDAGPIVGCNYLPRTAVNMTEMWQKETFDLNTIIEESDGAPRTVNVDASSSWDPDDDIVSYIWDFGEELWLLVSP